MHPRGLVLCIRADTPSCRHAFKARSGLGVQPEPWAQGGKPNDIYWRTEWGVKSDFLVVDHRVYGNHARCARSRLQALQQGVEFVVGAAWYGEEKLLSENGA